MILMKTFSIKQPWANLIINGKKTTEIRHWRHPYRGTLLIHTGRKHDPVGKGMFPDEPITPLGAILGTVDLVNIERYDVYEMWYKNFLNHLNPYDWFEPGLYGWVFANPRPLVTPIRMKGETGIFIVKMDKPLVTV